jgi:hypothetical protein
MWLHFESQRKTASTVSSAIQPRIVIRMWPIESLALAPSMPDASVGSKLFVTVGFVLIHHFIKRITGDDARRFELPVTL